MQWSAKTTYGLECHIWPDLRAGVPCFWPTCGLECHVFGLTCGLECHVFGRPAGWSAMFGLTCGLECHIFLWITIQLRAGVPYFGDLVRGPVDI